MGVRPQVVIVGAGFGGLAAARGLAKAPVEVTLVDRHNFTTFQPLLYQVATAGLNAADVAHPVRGLFHRQHNVSFRQGTVTGVDWEARRVLLAGPNDGPADAPHGPDGATGGPSDASTLASAAGSIGGTDRAATDRNGATEPADPADGPASLPFDHLIVAPGAVASWFGVPGAAEHALPLYTLEDAVSVRNEVVRRFEEADAAGAHRHPGALTFVVVGGGPTGVEMAGALAELFAVVFRRDYPHLDVARARVVLVETRDALLGPFHPSSQRHAAATLGARGVEVRVGETVAEVTPDHVRFASGEILPTRTVVWAAGVRPHPLVEALGLETDRSGRIVVDPDLSVAGRPGVWAIGDAAAAPDHRTGGPLPQLAPVAMQAGAHVARQITRLTESKPTQAFRFRDKGTMATIGRRAAITELPGRIRLHGTLAWLAWLGLHLLYLAGLRNRVSVVLNWAWGYITWDRGPRIILRSGGRRTREREPQPT
ncbi:MAG TPA: NAD(P)/FAD-dependent oxidoreductase [Acidimicrobiales bacterium]